MTWTDLESVREELLALLDHSATRQVVAFDADSTLWMSDIANRTWAYLLEEKLPSRSTCEEMSQLSSQYDEGRLEEIRIVKAQATGLAGFRVEELREIARAAFAAGAHSLADVCFAGMRELIDGLRGRGARVIVISGSPQVLVEEAARLYDIPAEDVGALRTGIVEGRLTGSLAGPLTTGEGKVVACMQMCGAPPFAAFGDAPTDIPLLRSATALAGLINPRPGLRSAAASLGARVRCIRIPRTMSGIEVPLPDRDESTIV